MATLHVQMLLLVIHSAMCFRLVMYIDIVLRIYIFI